MRWFHSRSWSAFFLSATLAGVVFIEGAGNLAAQTVKKHSDNKPPERVVLAKTTSGPYTMVVDRARWDFGKGVGMAHSGLPMQMPMQTFEKSQMNIFGDHKPGGTPQAPTNTMTGGMAGGSGGGGGGGGGWGGAFLRPNLILDVQVKNPQLAGKRQLICVPKDKVRALDDLGRQLDSTTDPPSMRTVLPGVEYPQGDGRMALHLYVPLNPTARYIQSIDGDLLVAEASVRSAKFQGADLAKPTAKRAGGGMVRLSKLQQSSEGIEVGIIAPPPLGASRPQPMNMMERLRQQQSRPQVTVELEDSEGGIHAPVSSSTEEQSNNESSSTQQLPGGGTSTTTTHLSGGMMSGSYSSSGSGGGTFGMGGGTNQPPKKAVQDGANLTGWKSPNESLPATNFRFNPLPDGIKVKSIRCTITDDVGPPKTVPFHLENVRLP